MDEVWSINRFAVDGAMPQLTIYMDIDPEMGIARIQSSRGREVNRLDLESLAFHKLVREGYLKLLEQFPERIVRVNAENAADVVLGEVILTIDRRFFHS
jgi:dTMP kinase